MRVLWGVMWFIHGLLAMVAASSLASTAETEHLGCVRRSGLKLDGVTFKTVLDIMDVVPRRTAMRVREYYMDFLLDLGPAVRLVEATVQTCEKVRTAFAPTLVWSHLYGVDSVSIVHDVLSTGQLIDEITMRSGVNIFYVQDLIMSAQYVWVSDPFTITFMLDREEPQSWNPAWWKEPEWVARVDLFCVSNHVDKNPPPKYLRKGSVGAGEKMRKYRHAKVRTLANIVLEASDDSVAVMSYLMILGIWNDRDVNSLSALLRWDNGKPLFLTTEGDCVRTGGISFCQ